MAVSRFRCFCFWFFENRAAAVSDVWQLDCGGMGAHGVTGCNQFATSGIATIGTSVTRAGPVPKPVSAACSSIVCSSISVAAADSQRCFSAVSPPYAAVSSHLIAHRTYPFGFQRDGAGACATASPDRIVPFPPMGRQWTERAGIRVSGRSISSAAATAR